MTTSFKCYVDHPHTTCSSGNIDIRIWVDLFESRCILVRFLYLFPGNELLRHTSVTRATSDVRLQFATLRFSVFSEVGSVAQETVEHQAYGTIGQSTKHQSELWDNDSFLCRNKETLMKEVTEECVWLVCVCELLGEFANEGNSSESIIIYSTPSLLYNGYWVFLGGKAAGACRWLASKWMEQ